MTRRREGEGVKFENLCRQLLRTENFWQQFIKKEKQKKCNKHFVCEALPDAAFIFQDFGFFNRYNQETGAKKWQISGNACCR